MASECVKALIVRKPDVGSPTLHTGHFPFAVKVEEVSQLVNTIQIFDKWWRIPFLLIFMATRILDCHFRQQKYEYEICFSQEEVGVVVLEFTGMLQRGRVSKRGLEI